MSSIIRTFGYCILLTRILSAQTYDVTLEKATGYNGWTSNWNMVYTMKNDIATVAVVPKLGGRVMQYNLGTDASIYIENDQQTPTSGNDLVGGFRMLPSPQADFGWPSPPNLDFNPYTCTERTTGTDSTVLYLESQVENSTDSKYQKHTGLQFARSITLYKASTRVKVEMTMRNKGTQSMTHGIWDITQTNAPNSNCWVYFQRNASSTLGGGKGFVQYMGESPDAAAAAEAATQWKPDAAEGNIMGVQFLKKVGKIGADCRAGWICFNNRQSGYAYVKTFTYENGKNYPDSGASVQAYIYKDYDMMEVEVLGPLVTLAAGDSTKLIENWYAARSFGPVLDVRTTGLITKKLAVGESNGTVAISGTFGLFQPGTVKVQLCSASGSVVGVVDSFTVTPTDSLRVNSSYATAPGAESGTVRLAVFDLQGAMIGTLDSSTTPVPLPAVGIGTAESLSGSRRLQTALACSNGSLLIDVPVEGRSTIKVFSINGRQLGSFSGNAPYHYSMNLSDLSSGVLLVNIEGDGAAETRYINLYR
ncbi:MAG: T9SS type A sorting domain-containing protein [Chitinispirillaceae bacterium]|nr:T9SS type A sorting domain-containing protein [Chitinispirillaceae bacterium]